MALGEKKYDLVYRIKSINRRDGECQDGVHSPGS